MSCVGRTKGWSWNAGGWLGMQERSLSANCLEGTTWLPSTRSLYLLSSSFHGAGPFSVELQFPRILFFAAPQTVRSAWQCASAFGTSGWCAETEPQCLPAGPAGGAAGKTEAAGPCMSLFLFEACPQPQAFTEPRPAPTVREVVLIQAPLTSSGVCLAPRASPRGRVSSGDSRPD